MNTACKWPSCFIVLLFALLTNATAQPKCKVEYYSPEQGLSHQSVTCMLKDREGFMWFGSWDGINRFDGHAFVSYKSSPGDMSQLRNDRIDQVVEDENGQLWIQAYDKQIYRFDKKRQQFLPLATVINVDSTKKVTFNKILLAARGSVWLQSEKEGLYRVPQNSLDSGRFTQYNIDQALDYRLPSNTINFFHSDTDNRIWIGTPVGLCCLYRNAEGIYKTSRNIPEQLSSRLDFTAFEEDAANLYFGTADGNLVIYDKKTASFSIRSIAANRVNALLRSKKNDIIYATTSGGGLISFRLDDQKISLVKYSSGEQLFSMYEDQKAGLWIEPQTLGIIHFDPLERSFQFFSQQNKDRFNLNGNRFKVFEDNNGIVWLNMKGGGFGYYNETKGSIDNLLKTPDGVNNQTPSIVYSIYYDNAGIIWLTTNERQLVKIVLQYNDFRQQLLVENSLLRTDNEVRGIFYDNRNRLWLGAKSGKVYVYQDDKEITGIFTNEPPGGVGLVYSILQDSRGNIWLGTKFNGLYKASPVNKEGTKYQLTHFLPDKTNSNALPCNEIYALLEDRQGRIWIGSFDEGLVLIKEDANSTQFIHAGNAFEHYPKGNYRKIRHMTTDQFGNIWIGTTNGLLVLNPHGNDASAYKYVSYSKISGEKESLGNNDVQFIYRDSKNKMWLATSGGGFCHAMGNDPFQSLKFRNYTTKDGMPNDYVLSCAEDRLGNLWIATANGLSKFNPTNEIFRNYDSYDGLSGAGFSEAAASQRLPNGQLVFGTTRGFLSFDPGRINNNRIQGNIVLTNLQINNEDAGPGTSNANLDNNINYTAELQLKYNQNIISIDYAILDYRPGERKAFAYRLLGFDSTWHDDRQQRRATYTNLPPGNYVFEVKSLSGDLYSNTPFRSLHISIAPPPWKTWWAYCLYALVTVFLLVLIWRIAISMIRLRHKIAVEQKLAALKLEFFTNISHELRTPLTLILSPIEQLAKKERLSPQGKAYIGIAQKNANRMIRFINQLLDLRKAQSNKASLYNRRVELVSFVTDIIDHFAEAAKSRNIRLDMSSTETELPAYIDADKMDVVIYNLLSNALKFTPDGKEIHVSISDVPAEKSFLIIVSDGGPGVPAGKLEEIFELFHAGDQSGQASKGTGIGLALAKEFVALHGGGIWASNNAGGGLSVSVKMKRNADQLHDRNTFLNKLPVQPETGDLLHEPAALLNGPEILTSTKPEAPLVLLVEDNDELRNFLEGQLGEFYRVETARNGSEGFEKATRLLPDLVLSDIMMPLMSGIEMLQKIRENVNSSHIPVVLLSAKYSIESQIEGLKYGADYYITKPFSNEFLIASIDNLLRQRKKMFQSLVEKKGSMELAPSAIVVTPKDELFLQEVIRAVESRMADTGFNIDLVAETLAMSRTTFYKKFKSLTGLTPVEFVRDMRLQRAKQYLDAGGHNISEIAYLAGFSNPKYFSTCFRDKYQVSPSDYLKAKVLPDTSPSINS